LTGKTTIQEQDYVDFQLPSTINKEKIPAKRGLKLAKIFKCHNCEVLLDEMSFYMVNLDLVVKAWEFDHIDDQKLDKK
jgi:hypothetical protein